MSDGSDHTGVVDDAGASVRGVVRSVDIETILARRRAYVGHIEDAAQALHQASIYGDGELEVRGYPAFIFPRPDPAHVAFRCAAASNRQPRVETP